MREGGQQGEGQSFLGETVSHSPGEETHQFLVHVLYGQVRTERVLETEVFFSLHKTEAEKTKVTRVITARLGRQATRNRLKV